MKNAITYTLAFTCIIFLFSYTVSAQTETQKRMENYLELKKLGYKDKAIFEDLGNANFLLEDYETALFWYERLKEISKNKELSNTYNQRYHYAIQKNGVLFNTEQQENRDWLAMIKSDYEVKGKPTKNKQLASAYRAIDAQLKDLHMVNKSEMVSVEDQKNYKAPMAITPDGNTAYFSKEVQIKPLYGIFSKKQTISKIYRADKMDGEWTNIKQVAVCPKYASAKHPTISLDGTRLFFASDMPGSFGAYDIYVANINSNGTYGAAKNLGEKVNTKQNDVFPRMLGDNTLFFASEGRNGQGGLDVYMVEVDQKKIGLAVNLGSPINSTGDDFSIEFVNQKGMGYVISNRGKNKKTIQQVAFTYDTNEKELASNKRNYNILEILNDNSKVNYSSSVYEDDLE